MSYHLKFRNGIPGVAQTPEHLVPETSSRFLSSGFLGHRQFFLPPLNYSIGFVRGILSNDSPVAKKKNSF